LPGDRRDHSQIDWPAQASVVDPQIGDPPPHHVRLDAAARRFNFW